MQDGVLGLQISEGLTVLCGKADMEMQHSFPKDPCYDERGDDTLSLTE